MTETLERTSPDVVDPEGPPVAGRRARRTEEPPARPRALTQAGLVDLAVLVALLAAVAVGFGPAWGGAGYVLPAAVGALAGLAVAWVGAARRWSTAAVAVALVLTYLVLGGPVALRSTTTAQGLPTLQTFVGLAQESVLSWKTFVTTTPPIASFPDLAVVPFALLLVTGVVAGTIAWRARHAAWALLPVAAALVLVILLGTIAPAHPVAQAVVIGGVGLLWASWRRTQREVDAAVTDGAEAAGRRLTRHRVRSGAIVLVGAALVAGVVGPLVAPSGGRTVLRETVVPPPDLHEYVSPLVGFRHYAKDLADEKVLTVRGLPKGARLRIATLDAYDGVVYAATSDDPASAVFVRAGEKVATDAAGADVTLDVTLDDYAGPWVPSTGALAGITYHGDRAGVLADGTYAAASTGTVITTAGLRDGESYTLRARVPDAAANAVPDKARVDAGVAVPAASDVPGSVRAKAEQLVGGETDPLKQLRLLATGLEKGGILSSGLDGQAESQPGHSAQRIDTLLSADEMVGDDEQFAVAYALMARSLGIPARVVMGAYPDEKDPAAAGGKPFVVTGRDVHAWIEVPFATGGTTRWVAFDAVPDEDNKVEPQPRSEQVPKPPVLEDPEPPAEPDQADTAESKDDEKKPDDERADDFSWGTALAVGAAVVIPLALLLSPFAAVLLLKSRRRERRRTHGDPVDRVSGGWNELLDTAVDLRAPVPAGATRGEAALALAGLTVPAASPRGSGAAAAGVTADQGDAGPDGAAQRELAHVADRSVFGPTAPTEDEVQQFWTGVDTTVGQMLAAQPWRRRLRARVSVRSLRASRARRARSSAPAANGGRAGSDGTGTVPGTTTTPTDGSST